ncbi:MAG: 2'-5' RNA ligase family protein [Candidatus Micrarchaeia archaeon]
MLIELRIASGKGCIKRKILEVRKELHLRDKNVIPHLTIYGDFLLGNTSVDSLAKIIERTAKKFDSVSFIINGFELKENGDGSGHVFALKVVPSKELLDLRNTLLRDLSEAVPSSKPWDKHNVEPWFHITIANHVISRANAIRTFISGKNESFLGKLLPFLFKEQQQKQWFLRKLDALRITLLNDSRKIVFEYDLPLKKVLNRTQALDRKIWASTLSEYRRKNGFELYQPNFDEGKKTYISSDLHLDHTNIIKYCARPFSSVREMNHVLLKNWNYTIKPSDKVYFLGDLSFGRGSRPPPYWLSHLNGKIDYIRGNHERGVTAKDYSIIDYRGYKFLLIHSPNGLPLEWGGWIIHGHVHNNDIKNYPFINGEKKTINVSVELTNYQPVDLDFLISLKPETIRRMETSASNPLRYP